MEIEEAICSIDGCNSIDELRSTLHRIVQDYGFSAFTFIDAGQPHLDEPYHVGTHELAWERTYLQNGFVHVDPALARVRRTNTPFHWGSLQLPAVDGRRKPGAVRTMEAAREHGFLEGLVVPFHFRDKRGALHSSSTLFYWKDKPNRFYRLFNKYRPQLHLIMVYWIQRAIDVAGREYRGSIPFFRPADHPAGIKLTDRERDVMSWAARGKTLQDTAEILRLSTETVETHIKNALRKLGATNKTHGAAKCVALGLVDL